MGTIKRVLVWTLLAAAIPMLRGYAPQINDTTTNTGGIVTQQTADCPVIFWGDSRTVGMSYSVEKNDNEYFVAKSEMGYQWFVQSIETARMQVTQKTAVVINFGVNDLIDYEKYSEKINELQRLWPCKIYYMSVNPVDDERLSAKGSTLTNELIDEFNTKIQGLLSPEITYIDTNAYMKASGYKTTDGLHYDKETYQKIHDYCIQEINKSLGER